MPATEFNCWKALTISVIWIAMLIFSLNSVKIFADLSIHDHPDFHGFTISFYPAITGTLLVGLLM
jgi:hypothetical protein